MATGFDFIVVPGDHIAEWMEDRGINAAELARRLGVPPKRVSELLRGKAPVSQQLAIDLERVTGIPARVWDLYETNYRSELARRADEEELARQYEQAKEFPLSYLRKFGYITASAKDRAGVVRQILTLFGAASIDAIWQTWSCGNVAYRRRAVGRKDSAALSVWLALGEQELRRQAEIPRFDRDKLAKTLPEIRSLTVDDPAAGFASAIAKLFDAGVVCCQVPAVPGLGVHGATRWLQGTPVVQLSLLGRSDDQLWFTLFHEIGHILLHGDSDLYLNGEPSQAEREADEFASNQLIPAEFIDRIPHNRDLDAIRQLAAEIGIAPSIVLGRAQFETGDFAWGHELKRKI